MPFDSIERVPLDLAARFAAEWIAVRGTWARSQQIARQTALLTLLVLVSALSFLGCASPESVESVALGHAAPENVASPPFFRVANAGGADLLLLGTIHLGPEGGWRFEAAIEAAIDRAAAVVLEVDLGAITPELAGGAIARHAMFAPGESLSSAIRPETAKMLDQRQDLTARADLSPEMLDRIKPWFVAIALTEVAIAETRYSGEESADQTIASRFASRERLSLETLDEQMAIFDHLDPAVADLFLRDTLTRYDEMPDSMRDLVKAWKSSDLPSLVAIAREGLDEMPELGPFYERILDDRNRRWARSLSDLLEDQRRAGSEILVAVGALHLVGEASLPRLLRDAGYAVERIEPKEFR